MSTSDVSSDLTIQHLLDAGLHFGHQTKRWNPKMKKFVFDKRNGIHVIDLVKTLSLLKIARQFIYDVVSDGKKVLLVGTKKQAQVAIKAAATRCNQPYVTTRWLGGTLTNSTTVRRSVKRLQELEQMEKNGAFTSMSKKEVARLRRELLKLQRNLCGVVNMDELPGTIVVVDVAREALAVSEANRLGIPVVGLLDTNADPDPVNYPIPGNDDSIRSVTLVIDAIADTIQKADKEWSKRAAEAHRRREEADAARKAAAAALASQGQVKKPKADEAPAGDREDVDVERVAVVTTTKEKRLPRRPPPAERPGPGRGAPRHRGPRPPLPQGPRI